MSLYLAVTVWFCFFLVYPTCTIACTSLRYTLSELHQILASRSAGGITSTFRQMGDKMSVVDYYQSSFWYHQYLISLPEAEPDRWPIWARLVTIASLVALLWAGIISGFVALLS